MAIKSHFLIIRYKIIVTTTFDKSNEIEMSIIETIILKIFLNQQIFMEH